MPNRNILLITSLGVIANAAFAQANQGADYLVAFSNSASASRKFQGFTYSSQSLGPAFSATGPIGALDHAHYRSELMARVSFLSLHRHKIAASPRHSCASSGQSPC